MTANPEEVGPFLEETNELLEDFENCLLVLETVPDDRERLNRVFRCAHTIKGNSAMLGFERVAGFTHEMEFLLDRLRSGAQALTHPVIETLLAAGDVLRALVAEVTGGPPSDSGLHDTVLQRIREAPTQQDAPRRASGRVVLSVPPPRLAAGGAPVSLLSRIQVPPIPKFADFLPAAAPQEPAVEPVAEATDVAPQPAASPRAMSPVQGRAAASAASAVETTSIRVPIERVDRLVNLVGELVIAQAMLAQLASQAVVSGDSGLGEAVAQMDRYCHELQERVLGIRMLPLRGLFQKFHRVIRDVAQATGKSVELEMAGEDTELDKTLIEKISDALTHLVRNAVDHGIEPVGARMAAGKPPMGRIILRAYQKSGSIFIEVEDDGHGLDAERILAKGRRLKLVAPDQNPTEDEVFALIFLPGFSTNEQVTELSGRGVGMDVVKRNVESLKGSISIRSVRGKGTCFAVKLPLTMAILDGLAIAVGSQVFVVPLVSVVELLRPSPGSLRSVPGAVSLLDVRGEYIPFLRLGELFGVSPCVTECSAGTVVILDDGSRRFALMTDEVLGQFQAVLKSLEANYRTVPGVSAATILGDGRVALVLDVGSLASVVDTPPAPPPRTLAARNPDALVEAVPA